MKKIAKLLAVLILGIIFVACGGKKVDNRLEGVYSLERIGYFADGTEAEKINANIEISRKGDLYTIIGKQIDLEKEHEEDWLTRKVTYGDWIKLLEQDFSFTGKIKRILESEPNRLQIPHEKVYVYELVDDENRIINIYVYKNTNIKRTISEIKEYANIKYHGEEISDMIDVYTIDKSINLKNIKAIKVK